MNTKQSVQRDWLIKKIEGLMPGFYISKSAREIKIYSPGGRYCGGVVFDPTSRIWLRAEPSVGSNRQDAKIPCSANLRQQVRQAVNQAIAELAEQQQAA